MICVFEDINELLLFFDILRCCENVHNNKKFSHGNS